MLYNGATDLFVISSRLSQYCSFLCKLNLCSRQSLKKTHWEHLSSYSLVTAVALCKTNTLTWTHTYVVYILYVCTEYIWVHDLYKYTPITLQVLAGYGMSWAHICKDKRQWGASEHYCYPTVFKGTYMLDDDIDTFYCITRTLCHIWDIWHNMSVNVH